MPTPGISDRGDRDGRAYSSLDGGAEVDGEQQKAHVSMMKMKRTVGQLDSPFTARCFVSPSSLLSPTVDCLRVNKL